MAVDGWVLSADGGGTKTDILLANGDLKSGVMVNGSGTNPNAQGELASERLEQLISSALERVEISGQEVRSAVLGMAGLSNHKYRSAFDKILERLVPSASVQIITDAELAHRAIWGHERGITLIVGTGSIAVGGDAQGNLLRAGGFGYQIGDIGSGYWLGKNLITQLIAMERSEAEEILDLKKAVVDHFGAGDFVEALDLASGGESFSRVAAMSSILLNHAEEGNFLAEQLARTGIEGLQELVEELTGKMGQHDIIGLHGSVITESSFYRSLLMKGLKIESWKRSEMAAVFGGLIITGSVETPEELRNFVIDYG
ncbi:MAG: BadF/BadG/BcrA/BcrD ATPase family protein [Candidatus Neomarinimicrobiota bacterium]|nr:BadF/BadG/BcrA/BcrD ATPase family protein [Candidatus Neomarinimicrobiota bacterium]